MRIIVLHDRFSNEPIVVKTSTIVAVKRAFLDELEGNKEEYSEIFAGANVFMVRETIGAVLTKIKKAESEE